MAEDDPKQPLRPEEVQRLVGTAVLRGMERVIAKTSETINISMDAYLKEHGVPGLELRITVTVARPPEPKFCRHPKICAGMGRCPRDPVCND